MSHIAALLHVQIPVKNLHAAIDWYCEHLGFSLQAEFDQSAFLALSTGPTLMLWETADKTSATFTVDSQPMPVFLFTTADIHSLYDHLLAQKVTITHYQNDGFGWVLKFFDPNDNMLGVIQKNE
ncbi:hypothetical protein BRE01_29940 [Brevibacillus reuszeri]|uniref:Lactoylglutathione lyase n=1 Tax=Brevibacillus reuszeri TaxID=54915 RepID=A0A0K9YJ89_9BACL|nr:VOC family protein [Brevibacillus reuszeri]KNB68773.1 lactoylglutathione lyase [Brevibacillus reuszeri]MED1859074.1 VOC family protein [Brevibacillus reuszeri]GED69292.1 hypothetical protein BRE01_29940 [Brevibacillus reuszeri]